MIIIKSMFIVEKEIFPISNFLLTNELTNHKPLLKTKIYAFFSKFLTVFYYFLRKMFPFQKKTNLSYYKIGTPIYFRTTILIFYVFYEYFKPILHIQ